MMNKYADNEIVNTINYSCHPKVTWVVESHGLLLIHHSLNKNLTLHYPDAAVWDLISQGFAHSRMVYLLAKIASTEQSEAAIIIRDCLEKLTKQGFLLKSE